VKLCFTEAFIVLYKSLVRSYVEYVNSVWKFYHNGLIKVIGETN